MKGICQPLRGVVGVLLRTSDTAARQEFIEQVKQKMPAPIIPSATRATKVQHRVFTYPAKP
tara:strand:- start:143 stop:325 length:183 start_codon:yes stop_codon:yes gene_type:complete